ncbi:MAG: hypothetical protein FJ265_15390 [Planctomycetes bacterium]|nr:hypothetical protein [Planctomycetota bacterium]
MTLNYTSITWASGKRIGEAMDKEKGANARNGINSLAPKKPLAAFSTTAPVKCGELELAAGEYKVYYTITDDCEWQINFQAADKVQTMKLPLLDSPEESKRLLMCLYAGETEGAGVYVAFGKQMCMLDFEPVKADKQG